MCACVCARMRDCMFVFLYILCLLLYKCVFVHMCAYMLSVCVCVCVFVCVCSHINVYLCDRALFSVYIQLVQHYLHHCKTVRHIFSVVLNMISLN